MLLGRSSPLRGDLVGGEMPAPDEVTAVVGGCTNWLRDEANCRRVGAAGTGEALSCGERLVAVHQLRPREASQPARRVAGGAFSVYMSGYRDRAMAAIPIS
jgi:hypothetical protein